MYQTPPAAEGYQIWSSSIYFSSIFLGIKKNAFLHIGLVVHKNAAAIGDDWSWYCFKIDPMRNDLTQWVTRVDVDLKGNNEINNFDLFLSL